jgi:hypothetical protein
MNGPQKRPHAPIQVDDPAAGLQRMQALGRKILAVPKGEVDAAAAKEKAKNKNKGGKRS